MTNLSLGLACLAFACALPAQKIDLRSAYLTTKVATAHQIRLQGEIGGEAVVELDPNACTVGPFGDAGACTEIGPVRLDVRLVQAKLADPLGMERKLFGLDGDMPNGTRMWFVTKGKSPSARLIVQGGDSPKIVVPLFPAPPAAPMGLAAMKTKTVDAGGLQLAVPTNWSSEEPSSSMRLLQMKVPGKGGVDAELVVFKFGRSDIDANIQRWAGQFESDGREMMVKTGKCERGEYTLVHITGTQRGGGGPFSGGGGSKPNTGVMHVILPDERSLFFVKLIGPQDLVRKNADVLRRAFGGDASTERVRD